MKIAITGATGHLGNTVIQELLDKKGNDTIIAVVRNKEKADKQFPAAINIRYGNYNDYASLLKAFSEVDKLLFISSPSNDDMERVVQHATVIKAARDASVGQIYYTTFSHADYSTISLAKLHLATEAAIKVSNLDYTFIRNPLYSEVFINASLKESVASGELVTNTGKGTLNTASRDDLAKAAATLLCTDGYRNEIVDLASSHLWSFDDLAETLTEASGKKVIHRAVSQPEAIQHFVASGMPEPAAEFTAGMYQAISDGDISQTEPHLTKLIGQETTLKEIISRSL